MAAEEKAEGPDLVASGLLGGLPAALLAGRDRGLLDPLRFLPAGASPSGEPPAVDRRALANGLGEANASYGHPRAAALAARLADPATRVVVTGQQVGVLGGPLYALVKAAAAVRWAETLEAQGQPAVAVFWMATEDHDWAEVATSTVLAPDGPRRLDLGPDPAPLLPVGMRTLGEGMTALLGELAALFPAERYGAWLAELGAWYRPDARFGEAFARLFVRLFGARSPLLLDALLPAVKQAQAPWLARLVEARREHATALAAVEARVLAAGHALQVAPQPGASPLFLLRGGERRRIEWRGEAAFGLRGRPGEEPLDLLFETLRENPGVVGPGVLARPAIQDAILGTTLQVMGPGEVAYLAQAAPAYALLGVAAPWVALRPQALVLDARQRAQLAELGVELGDLLAAPQAAERRLGERAGAGFVQADRAGLESLLASWREAALAIDPQLERPWEKTRDQLLGALEQFSARVAAAAARRDEVGARRFAALRDHCLPGGVLQERSVAAAHFPGKYGDAFVAALLAQLDLDPRRLSLIDPGA